MSNSSDSAVERPLTLLLQGVAQECSTLGNSIASMGDDLSSALNSGELSEVIGKFQAFDMMAQNAHAQARVIFHITRLLFANEDASKEELLGLVEDMPIHDVRRRLKALLGADVDVLAAADDEDWFL